MRINNNFLVNTAFVVLVHLLVITNIAYSQMDASANIVSQDQSFVVNAVNNESFTVYLVLDFPQLKGLEASSPLPTVIPLAPGKNDGVYVLKYQQNVASVKYSAKYGFLYGDPINNHPDDTLYFFPYQHGMKHRITQGWHGEFTHSGQNEYGLDFDLAEGTGVYAARGGTVIDIKKDSDQGGIGSFYDDKANFIIIRHDDGTFGNYVHLMKNGVLVAPGDIVETGTLIGYSGNTGYSSGAHLHFDVRVPLLSGIMQSIPVFFRELDNTAITPKQGESYYAKFDGGPPFEVVRGKDLSLDDYKGYKASVSQDFPRAKIQLRKEVIDNTIVMYIENGFDTPISAEVALTLSNLRSDKSLPISIHVPARTEGFLTLLRIVNTANNYRIQSRMTYTLTE